MLSKPGSNASDLGSSPTDCIGQSEFHHLTSATVSTEFSTNLRGNVREKVVEKFLLTS